MNDFPRFRFLKEKIMALKNLELEQLFQDIISKLKKDERPKIFLTPEIIQKILIEWQDILRSELSAGTKTIENKIDKNRLHQILCILDNTHNLTLEFQSVILETLKKAKDAETIIYTLAAAKKHIVEENLKNGQLVPAEFMEQLKLFLKSPNAEVQEWALRTVDDLGPLGLRLREEIHKHRPGFGAFFNKHKKNSLEIIDHLERKWNELKKK